MIRKLETFAGRYTFQVQGLDRPQKLGIFYEGTKIESETSPIGFILI